MGSNATTAPAGEKLAIHGGKPVLNRRYPSVPFRLGQGVRKSYDLMHMLSLTIRGYTSEQVEGGAIGRFEEAFRAFSGSAHALTTNTGTAALHSAYFAAGVGPGCEVIVPAYTWHASATPILACGAVPVFCEVDPVTLNLDPDDVERRLSDRTRAILVLHAWGNPAPMDRLIEIARPRNIALIEDCSHAHGALYHGKPVGTVGDFGCFSLGGAKPINGGTAGVVVTDDAEAFDRMLLLAHNGRVAQGQAAATFDFGDISLGLKFLPHIASMHLAKASLERLPARNARATRTWQILCEEFEGNPGIRAIPVPDDCVRGGFYFNVFEYLGADLGGPDTLEFVEAVRAEGVPIDPDEYRGILLHQLPIFSSFDRRTLGGCFYDPTRPWEENLSTVSLPVTERITDRLIRLPTDLWGTPESYVRGCARAIKKVLHAFSG